jgi:hypothetical protein
MLLMLLMIMLILLIIFFREEIDNYISDVIDWTLTKNAKQWNAVVEYLQTRAQLNSYQLVGKVQTSFQYNRDSLLKGELKTIVE